MADPDLLGSAWLAEHFDIRPVQPLAVRSEIGGRRSTLTLNDHRVETYLASARFGSSPAAHINFMLKHEGVPLELLARLFDRMDPEDLAGWIRAEPTGQYARRACFLFEWITGRSLPVADGVAGGNYVDALPREEMVVATVGTPSPRWRVRDNLPGTRDFCPVVRLTPAARKAAEFDIAAAFAEQEAEFGAELLRRSAVWLTLRESRSSFVIEGEQDQTKRIQRFAAVLETRTGQGQVPLAAEDLAQLQEAILGKTTTLPGYGLRQSPVYVGQTVRYENVVHYVAPPWEEVPRMVDALRKFLNRTEGAASVMRAAVASFGFVYIHPLSDGNGRVHRFLINDILRRDGAVHAPFILPVSALITDTTFERASYDRALEVFSKPLMGRFAEASSFRREPVAQPDGVLSNFEFAAYDEAMPAWRFIDLTLHVEYMSGVIDRTIRKEMHSQAAFFRAHDEARQGLKEVIEGPDAHLDAIIRSIRQNGGRLSNKLNGQFPQLEVPGVWEQVARVVNEAFAAPGSDQSRPDVDRPRS
ncbi:hypothetical protein J2W27_004649 [Variovorax boronicumulans]|uniref:Fic family protein n=1 Tax=Variovorax boronicumulans TaxID=436515 RepID=UPI002783F308|nr:Fic family protein [Variovorax boronicumulans]MDP9912523.1 hypothetical protein [Variovorax boronicumulans]